MSVYFSLTDAFHIPKPILCGGFEQLLQGALVWFSSGGTKSVLHNDGPDNINCIFDGTKEMILFDKVNITYFISHLYLCAIHIYLRWPNTSGFETSRSTWTC